MPPDIHDGEELVRAIRAILKEFEKSSELHQQDESFVAVDNLRYTMTAKIHSPFGDGEWVESIASSNELQQYINRWMGVQRELGRLVSIRLVVTPSLEELADTPE